MYTDNIISMLKFYKFFMTTFLINELYLLKKQNVHLIKQFKTEINLSVLDDPINYQE